MIRLIQDCFAREQTAGLRLDDPPDVLPLHEALRSLGRVSKDLRARVCGRVREQRGKRRSDMLASIYE